MTDAAEAIRVACRFRPMNSKEKHEEKTQDEFAGMDTSRLNIRIQKNLIIVPREGNLGNKDYTMDDVIDSDKNQEESFRILAQPLVQKVIEGYNATIFAYGQTGFYFY